MWHRVNEQAGSCTCYFVFGACWAGWRTLTSQRIIPCVLTQMTTHPGSNNMSSPALNPLLPVTTARRAEMALGQQPCLPIPGQNLPCRVSCVSFSVNQRRALELCFFTSETNAQAVRSHPLFRIPEPPHVNVSVSWAACVSSREVTQGPGCQPVRCTSHGLCSTQG